MPIVSRAPQLSVLALALATALGLGQAHAAGFQIRENSVKAMGRAFAGSAAAPGDASVVAGNPAAMSRFAQATVQADITLVDPSATFQGGGTDAFGRPLSGGDGGDAGDLTPIPALSFVLPLPGALDGVTLGAMVSAPFGLKTEYEDGWMGRYYAHTSELKVVDLTFAAALELVPDHLSVGVGVIHSRAEVTLSKSVDFGTALFGNPATRPLPFARPQMRDGFAEVRGDDSGFGWILGITFRPTDKLAIGYSHRSEIDYGLTGAVDWTVPQDVAAVFAASPATRVLFQDGNASAGLTTPTVDAVAVDYRVTDQLSLALTYAETGWESLQEMRIDFANPDADSIEAFNWDSTRFLSIGGEYRLNEAWTLRAGYAYDETPTTFAHRTPRLPDEDRKWYSIGATWQMSGQLGVSFAYTRIQPDRPQVGIITPSAQGGQGLFGSYDSAVNLLGVSAQYAF